MSRQLLHCDVILVEMFFFVNGN